MLLRVPRSDEERVSGALRNLSVARGEDLRADIVGDARSVVEEHRNVFETGRDGGEDGQGSG